MIYPGIARAGHRPRRMARVSPERLIACCLILQPQIEWQKKGPDVRRPLLSPRDPWAPPWIVHRRGVKREGAFYLCTLRLIPVFPFFVFNLVMGITRIPLRTFFWVSQIGMLPATLVYVNAGRELGKIDSLSGLLSPSLIFSFILLGLFPVTVKTLMPCYR